MSWYANYIGTSDKISAALTKQSAGLSGPSKVEFDAALSCIQGLLGQNYNKAAGATAPVLRLTASGSGYEQQQSCTVNIENLGGALV
jgi:hypothetical protein